MRVERPLHPHHAVANACWGREVLTTKIENPPVVGQFQRRHALAKLGVEDGIIFKHEQSGRVSPLRCAEQESE